MTCKFCGFELNEGAAFCPECGKAVTEEPVVENTEPAVAENTAPVEENKSPVISAIPSNIADKIDVDKIKKAKKKLDINKVSLIVGIVIIIIGVIRLMSSSVSISSTSFGADFYTYAYRGIVACAEMLGSINATASWILIAIGALIDINALKGMSEKK